MSILHKACICLRQTLADIDKDIFITVSNFKLGFLVGLGDQPPQPYHKKLRLQSQHLWFRSPVKSIAFIKVIFCLDMKTPASFKR